MYVERIESQGVGHGANPGAGGEHGGIPTGRRATLYAQVLEGRTQPEQRPALDRAMREQLIPALREEEGFCGALHLVDCRTGETMIVVCWETEEQAAGPYCESSERALAAIAAASSELDGRSAVWEVGARA
jgi:hypothetical protein